MEKQMNRNAWCFGLGTVGRDARIVEELREKSGV